MLRRSGRGPTNREPRIGRAISGDERLANVIKRNRVDNCRVVRREDLCAG
jgi:hypothetical protein